ncbi:MAG: DUF2018 family protein [Campylobacterales bacterium]
MFDFFDEQKSAVDKFFEIIFHANRNLVREELEQLFRRMATLEVLGEECFGEELEQKLQQIEFQKSDLVEEREVDLYIHTMAQILTKNE